MEDDDVNDDAMAEEEDHEEEEKEASSEDEASDAEEEDQDESKPDDDEVPQGNIGHGIVGGIGYSHNLHRCWRFSMGGFSIGRAYHECIEVSQIHATNTYPRKDTWSCIERSSYRWCCWNGKSLRDSISTKYSWKET